MANLVECLPCIHEAMASLPDVVAHTFHPLPAHTKAQHTLGL